MKTWRVGYRQAIISRLKMCKFVLVSWHMGPWSVTDCHFRLLTQRVTFDTSETFDQHDQYESEVRIKEMICRVSRSMSNQMKAKISLKM